MKERIYSCLLLMGVLAIFLTFALSSYFYYQGIRVQVSQEMAHMTNLAAESMTDDNDRNREYLSRIIDRAERNMRISWVDQDGNVIYESQSGEREDYMDEPEMQQALQRNTGHDIRKNASGRTTYYYARQLDDGSILRFSAERNTIMDIMSPAIPGIIGLLILFLLGCMFAAGRLTRYLLRPLSDVGTAMEEIMNGKPGTLIAGYSELEPLIAKVRNQKEEIQNYLRDIEEDRNTIRTVIDTISDGIILLNDKREIIDYNKKVQDIFDLKADMRCRMIAVVYHDADWLRAISRAYTKDRQVYTMTLGGKPFQAIMTRAELSESMTGLLIVLRDMTASYAAEKMRREFSANVSHELKTPLTSISGFAEMIAAGMYEKPEDVKMFGSRIYEEARRLLSLIDTIMHLSKIEEKATTITWKAVPMADLVNHAVDILQPLARRRDVTIQADLSPLYVYGNASLLAELVMNIIDNAVKYNREHGSIRIVMKPADSHMIFTVSDTGIGIPKEKQNRVFERFYRADESRNKLISGTGLGLAICKHIVTQHHGTVSIRSVEGEGTTVTVVLPRMSDADVNTEKTTSDMAIQEAADAEAGILEQEKQELPPAEEPLPEEKNPADAEEAGKEEKDEKDSKEDKEKDRSNKKNGRKKDRDKKKKK